MRNTKKTIRNLIIFILLIILTFYIILKEQNITDIFNVLLSVKIEFIIIAIIAMCIYISCEAINIGRTLKALNEKSSFIKNVKYTLIGFFFSSITPAASGGQPMEIYYMYRDKISVANSTLALLMQLSSIQIVSLSFAIISLFFNLNYLNTALLIFFIIGVSLNATALALLLIGIFSKRLSLWLIKVAVKVLKFFRIKNIEAKQEKLEKEITKYQGSAVYIKSHMSVMIKTIFTTFVQICVYFSIPYWVYLAFGLQSFNILEIMSLQSIVYATVSFIPSPGAVGVSEGSFMALFSNIFPSTMISSAMLLNRGISFYLFVIASGLLVVINLFRVKKDILEIEEKNT